MNRVFETNGTLQVSSLKDPSLCISPDRGVSTNLGVSLVFILYSTIKVLQCFVSLSRINRPKIARVPKLIRNKRAVKI